MDVCPLHTHTYTPTHIHTHTHIQTSLCTHTITYTWGVDQGPFRVGTNDTRMRVSRSSPCVCGRSGPGFFPGCSARVPWHSLRRAAHGSAAVPQTHSAFLVERREAFDRVAKCMCVCVCVHLFCVCMCVFMGLFVYLFACLRVCVLLMSVCMCFVCVCVCVCVCVHFF